MSHGGEKHPKSAPKPDGLRHRLLGALGMIEGDLIEPAQPGVLHNSRLMTPQDDVRKGLDGLTTDYVLTNPRGRVVKIQAQPGAHHLEGIRHF